MSDVLRPCDCESGFCNRLPNPFNGHICRQDTIEMSDELNKAHSEIERLNKALEWHAGKFSSRLIEQQTITIPEHEVAEPVWEPVEGEIYCFADPTDLAYCDKVMYDSTDDEIVAWAERGLLYPNTTEGREHAVERAKGMCVRRERCGR